MWRRTCRELWRAAVIISAVIELSQFKFLLLFFCSILHGEDLFERFLSRCQTDVTHCGPCTLWQTVVQKLLNCFSVGDTQQQLNAVWGFHPSTSCGLSEDRRGLIWWASTTVEKNPRESDERRLKAVMWPDDQSDAERASTAVMSNFKAWNL